MKNKLIEWELTENPLAPLVPSQRDAFLEISGEVGKRAIPHDLPQGLVGDPCQKLDSSVGSPDIDGKSSTSLGFLKWYSQIEEELEKTDDFSFVEMREVLIEARENCSSLINQIDGSLQSLDNLLQLYEVVSTKTNSLHQVSEQLLADQTKLTEINESVGRCLGHFTSLDPISNQISSPTLDVTSEVFINLLDRLDLCIEYMRKNSTWNEAPTYLIKYGHCLTRALALVENHVLNSLEHATLQATAPTPSQHIPGDTVFALCYGKFQASAPKIKPLLLQMELRINRFKGYEQVLLACHQSYFTQRDLLMSLSVAGAMKELTQTATHQRDHCSLVRSGCAFLVHICHDEYQLFFQFFHQHTPLLTSFLEKLCTTLYDVLRPFIIHINHLETLAEVCSILRLEMLEEHVQNNPAPLEAFGRVAWQLLHDVQERLVYRAHCYLKSDVLQYQPSPGDLAYPEKLEMMETIAQSLHESQAMRRSESRSSLASIGSVTSQEVARINSTNILEQPRSRTGNSPADLHGMWYPTVRRVLVCLSRLYRCVDRPIFQGLSQEALSMCIQSIASAASKISANKSVVDGELFQIKHLLILREQIAPFQVDFTVKEMSLDFSKVKTAAFSLLNKRKRLLTFGTNNAILEFLLEGTPQVKEQLVDSRKEVDRQLKASCENFIVHVSKSMAGNIFDFIEKSQDLAVEGSTGVLSKQSFASPEVIGNIVHETQRLIKTNVPLVQRSIQLYLANRETEFILFRPIKNTIVACFGQLQTVLAAGGYSADDLLVIGCPSQEQISVLLSSASLLASSSAGEQHKVSSPVTEEETVVQHKVSSPVTEEPTVVQHEVSSSVTEEPTVVQHKVSNPVTEEPTLVQHEVSSSVTEEPTVVQHKVSSSVTEEPTFVQHKLSSPVTKEPTVVQPEMSSPVTEEPAVL